MALPHAAARVPDRIVHAPAREETTRCGALVIDHAAHEVYDGERAINLTVREYALLRLMATNPRRVYSRTALTIVLWGEQRVVGLRTIDGHVRRLRAKLGPDLRDHIRTVHGVGYAFHPPRSDVRD